jgi:hypothetical protein
MSISDLASLPRHLLAATLVRGRQRVPVRIRAIAPDAIVVGPAPLAIHESARMTIACPLADTPCELVARAVRKRGDQTWLAVVPS